MQFFQIGIRLFLRSIGTFFNSFGSCKGDVVGRCSKGDKEFSGLACGFFTKHRCFFQEFWLLESVLLLRFLFFYGDPKVTLGTLSAVTAFRS